MTVLIVPFARLSNLIPTVRSLAVCAARDDSFALGACASGLEAHATSWNY